MMTQITKMQQESLQNMENDGQQNHHVEQTPQSELAVIVAACWSVVKSRKSTYFPRVLDFIECVYRRAPDLLHYRHYAKLSLGLCARITLDLIAKEGTNDETWRTCQQLFLKIVPDATLNVKHRDLWKVQSAKVNFQKMVQRLFEDEEFRNCYMKEQVAEDYGEAFVAVLENLLRELLVRLNTALYENSSQQLLSALERFDIQTDSVSHSELMKTPNPQSRKIVKPLLNNKQRQKRLT